MAKRIDDSRQVIYDSILTTMPKEDVLKTLKLKKHTIIEDWMMEDFRLHLHTIASTLISVPSGQGYDLNQKELMAHQKTSDRKK